MDVKVVNSVQEIASSKSKKQKQQNIFVTFFFYQPLLRAMQVLATVHVYPEGGPGFDVQKSFCASPRFLFVYLQQPKTNCL